MKPSCKKRKLLRRTDFNLFRGVFNLFLIVGIWCVSLSFAQRLPIKTYTVADGLLRDSVYKIKQDSHGFMWFCTLEGISRFDGYSFTNFTVADGLPERHANDFLETRKGDYLIGTSGGLARLNPHGLSGSKENPLFYNYLPDNPAAKKISVLFEDENSRIWVGTSDGLYQLNENFEFKAVNLGESLSNNNLLSVKSIIKDRRGAMWIGTELSGLFRLLPNGKVERFTTRDGLPDVNISTLHEDKNGRVWVGLRPNIVSGLCLLAREPKKNQNIVERCYTVKNGLPADWITNLFESSDGKFWVGTTRGLCEWQGGETAVCKTYTEKNNLCDREIWSITEDKDNNLWTGTRCGTKKWTRYGFTTFNEADGMGASTVNSIFENAAGELFVSFINDNTRTVSRFDGEKFDLIKPDFPPEMNYSGWGEKQTVWQDAAGDWWFPTGAGLYRFPPPVRFEDLAKIAPQRISFTNERREIFRFYEDSRGDFWLAVTGAANELWHWNRTSDKWSNFSRETGIGATRLGTAFVEDKAGNLWIGTGSDYEDTALIRYRGGQFEVFSQKENELLAGWIRDLFLDAKGRLWIADSATGLLRLDDVNAEQLNFTRYTTAEGLSSIAVLCVTEDAFGRIYVGTGRGLDRLNPDTGQIENFTTADGLPNSEVLIAYRDRKNDLWFGTSDGLARFKPEPERQRLPPNVLITGVRVSGVPQNISILGETEIAPMELASDQRQITVEFLGLGASLGERLKYEYRFGDADWTPTAERVVNFANLSAGNYKFEVRAQTADRIYSQTTAFVSFRIAAPIWQRPWFLLLAVFSIAGLIYLFYKYRLQRLLELEKVRMRIATDLHDDIGANLTRISLLSEVAKQKSDNGKPSNLLTSIADIARESVASMNDIVWAISPDHDSLLDLTRRMRQHAEEVFAMRDIDLKFNATDADLKLSVGVRRDVLLIFKEAVNNTAKHADCSKVAIDFRCENSVLSLRIADDGKGFEKDAENDGQGLRSMTRRADSLGGNLTIDSVSGTIIEFKMPIQKISRV